MAFSGYWHNPQASREALVDGWYRTGDVGHLDTDGRLHLRDRLKDLIISGGENIYPAELEATLLSHPEVAEVAVVGRSDDRWGEVPVAFVVRTPRSQVNDADLIAHARTQLASFKTLKAVTFVDQLPKNAVGKILRRQLRD